MPALTFFHLLLAPPTLEETLGSQPAGGLRLGGRYRPPACEARGRTAVVVPLGSRDQVRLRMLLGHLHAVLQRQQLEYAVYAVQQATEEGPFNRDWLLNAGVREALSDAEYECLVLHDVDLLPENDRNLYTCEPQLGPKHLAVAIDEFRYMLPYESYFGGVVAMTPAQYMRISGFPGNYRATETHDDIATRIRSAGMLIYRPPASVARYRSTRPHHRPRTEEEEALTRFPKRFPGTESACGGLDCTRYRVLSKKRFALYTGITVEAAAPLKS